MFKIGSSRVHRILVLTRIKLSLGIYNSKLGFLNVLVAPLFFSLILFFVFSFIRNTSLSEEFFFYIYSGVILVRFFVHTSIAISREFEQNLDALKTYPSSLLIYNISELLRQFVNYQISFWFLMFWSLLNLENGFLLSVSLSLLPLILFPLILLMGSIGAFLISLIPDFRQIFPLIVNVAYYLTPVFYKLQDVHFEVRQFWFFSPVTLVLEFQRFQMSLIDRNLVEYKLVYFVTIMLAILLLPFVVPLSNYIKKRIL